MPRKVTQVHTNQSQLIQEFIKNYMTEKGFSPTVEEVSILLGTTKSTAYARLKKMRKFGEINFISNTPRTFTLPGQRVVFD